MHQNIYSYGCSHTFGTTHDGKVVPYVSYLANLLDIPNIFNHGQNSAGNEYNRKKLINHYLNDEIKKNSLIVFQLTQYHRKSYQLIYNNDTQLSNTTKLDGRVGFVDGILHILQGMFNRNDSDYDEDLIKFSNIYHERLSGEKYIMYDDIFSTYSVLNLISSKIKNVNFLLISWPEISSDFNKYLPNDLSNIWEWSLKNKLTEHDSKNNGDYHLSSDGHKKLAEKIYTFLQK